MGAAGGIRRSYSLGLDPAAMHDLALPVVRDGAGVDIKLQYLETSSFQELPQLLLPCPTALTSVNLKSCFAQQSGKASRDCEETSPYRLCKAKSLSMLTVP